MSDTQRTRAQILALLADNVTGQISAQDLRDFVVTIMETEFSSPGDFWAKPQAKYTLTDKTARGQIEYSQYLGSAVSWMNIVYQDQSTGYWLRADVADSTKTGRLGLAMDSYAKDYSTGQILIEGLVYDSSFSTIFSRLVGRPVYLESGIPGSVSIGQTGNSELVIGWIVKSDDTGDTTGMGKWYFKADWSIKGS